MKEVEKSCVVIPVFKEFSSLTVSELTSLGCLKCIFLRSFIRFISPFSLDISGYLQFAESNEFNAEVIFFDDFYFSSITGYNHLLLSKSFYLRFSSFENILIFQTDAFIFRNELDQWANSGFDYIGAPWFDSWRKNDPTAKIVGVGNGGFSLRNTSKAISILNRVNLLRAFNRFWQKHNLERFIKYNHFILPFNRYFKIKKFYELGAVLNEEIDNEDIFWAVFVADVFADYRVAPVEEALKFSFECNPRILYKMNGNKLPFGCHAWEKFDPDFWKPFIPFK